MASNSSTSILSHSDDMFRESPVVKGHPVAWATCKTGEEKPLVSRKDSYIRHKVTSADTLVNVACRYNVSVSLLMRHNRLTNSDIWFKDELIIPRSELPAFFEAASSDIIEAADVFCKVSALAKATGLDEDIARLRLQLLEGNFDLAFKTCCIARDWTQKYGITLKEAFAQLDMHDQDVTKAERWLIEDMQWHKEYERRNESPSCLSGALFWGRSRHNELTSSQSTRGDSRAAHNEYWSTKTND